MGFLRKMGDVKVACCVLDVTYPPQITFISCCKKKFEEIKLPGDRIPTFCRNWDLCTAKGNFLTFHGIWKTSLQTSLLRGERL
jgi:hypothetical protein